MTQLYCDSVMEHALPLCDSQRAGISARLAAIGVEYAHLALPKVRFGRDAGQDEVIGSYIEPLDRLLSRLDSVELEVTSVAPGHARLARIERELMTGHAHDVAEAQVLVHGGGVLFMRAGNTVFALDCEPGDYVRVPAGLVHWFAMDTRRGFRTIRLFENEARPRISQRGHDMRGRYRLSIGQRQSMRS